MPSKILITGGTGLIGSKLRSKLEGKQHEVRILTTSAVKAEEEHYYYWNLKDQYIDQAVFEGLDYIIHLAGAGVADERWNEKRKKVIYDSRIKNTELLFERAKNAGIKGILAASAVGYYGFDSGDQWMDEDGPTGDGFLAEVVRDWEDRISYFKEITDQVYVLRIGIVLSKKGGALKEMMPPFKFGFGAPLGSGTQWMSWIHIDDRVDMFIHGLENNLSGIFNGVGPNPETNRSFSKKLASTLGKPMWMPNVPKFALSILFGELAQIVVGGNKVKAEKIQSTGFTFQYTELDDALQNLLEK